MNKFNRKFNTRCKKIARWCNIVSRLTDFEGIINSYDGASPEEVRTMKIIHKKLYECVYLAKAHLKEAKEIDGFFRQNI